MCEIVNRQRKIQVDTGELSGFAERLFGEISQFQGKTATIALVSDRKMRELNGEFRGKLKTTDVLSFPLELQEFQAPDDNALFIGDIVISTEQALRQSLENGLSFDMELKQLVLHGAIHLVGYDHETDNGEMNRLEMKLREELEIS